MTFRCLQHWKKEAEGFLAEELSRESQRLSNRKAKRQHNSVGKATEYGLWPVQKVLNVERTGLHAFRHAAASKLLEEAAPLTVVSSFIVLSPLSVRGNQVLHGWYFPTFKWPASAPEPLEWF